MLTIPLDKLIALLDELENNVVGAQLRWRQLRRLIDQEAAQSSVRLIRRYYACPNCGSGNEAYHEADCPANPHNANANC